MHAFEVFFFFSYFGKAKLGSFRLLTFLLELQLPILEGDSREIDEEVAKEWEHTLLQNTMDKELHELNRRLEEKEVFSIYYNSQV